MCGTDGFAIGAAANHHGVARIGNARGVLNCAERRRQCAGIRIIAGGRDIPDRRQERAIFELLNVKR